MAGSLLQQLAHLVLDGVEHSLDVAEIRVRQAGLGFNVVGVLVMEALKRGGCGVWGACVGRVGAYAPSLLRFGCLGRQLSLQGVLRPGDAHKSADAPVGDRCLFKVHM